MRVDCRRELGELGAPTRTPMIAALEALMVERGGERARKRHQICLSGAGRSACEQLGTVVRQLGPLRWRRGRPPDTEHETINHHLIQRPPGPVFALLADIQDHEPIPLDARVRMTKHPSTATRVGTRWDEKVKLAPGWWMSIESVVTDIRSPSLLGMDFNSAWLHGHLTYTIDASPNGATLHQRETVRLRWPLRWFTRHVERRLRAQLIKRLAELRDLLEADR